MSERIRELEGAREAEDTVAWAEAHAERWAECLETIRVIHGEKIAKERASPSLGGGEETK